MNTDFAVSFYCAAVIERGYPDSVRGCHCESASDDSDRSVARWAAEVEAAHGVDIRTFFTVYRIDGEGLHYAVSDHRDRAEARQIAALLNAGLQVPDLLQTCRRVAKAILWATSEDRMSTTEQVGLLCNAINKAGGE